MAAIDMRLGVSDRADYLFIIFDLGVDMNKADLIEIIDPIIGDVPVGKVDCVVEKLLDKIQKERYLEPRKPKAELPEFNMRPVLIPKRRRTLWTILQKKKRNLGLIFLTVGGVAIQAGSMGWGLGLSAIGALFGGVGLAEHAVTDINWEKIIWQVLHLLEKMFQNSSRKDR